MPKKLLKDILQRYCHKMDREHTWETLKKYSFFCKQNIRRTPLHPGKGIVFFQTNNFGISYQFPGLSSLLVAKNQSLHVIVVQAFPIWSGFRWSANAFGRWGMVNDHWSCVISPNFYVFTQILEIGGFLKCFDQYKS